MKKILISFLMVLLCAGMSWGNKTLPSINAGDLQREAEQNKPKFDKNYMGKQILVSGFVGEIKETASPKGYSMRLQFKPGSGIWIGCLFSPKAADVLSELEYKAPLKIKGAYKGKQSFQIEDIVLVDCEVVK